MKNLLKGLFSAPYQLVLVVTFSTIAVLTITIGAWVISRTIGDYLTVAMNERIDRDMHLAQVFYNQRLAKVEEISGRIAIDSLVIENVHELFDGNHHSYQQILQQIHNNLFMTEMGGNYLVFVQNRSGDLLAGANVLMENGQLQALEPTKEWESLEVIESATDKGIRITSTEVIPYTFLDKAGIAEQARIAIYHTPKAAPELVDPREQTDGLALISVSLLKSSSNEIIGTVTTLHLLNNDFTLVDKIKDLAGVDSATIFLGDLRISTNVLTIEGDRAIGTRVSEEVSQVIFGEEREFIGKAFVVVEDYITRYDPIRNHSGEIVGILYVGSKQASFQRLINTFNQRILLVALGMVLLTIIITTPVSLYVTWPLRQLKSLVAANERVAKGDMSVRVPVLNRGEIGMLERSFNSMLDTLQATQDQLIQTEKLASIGQLAAGVAHELNNPLGTILLYSDILMNEIPQNSSHKKDLEIIVNETKRCKWIVSSLLEFARHNQVFAQPTELNDLILYVMEVEGKHYEMENIEFWIELDPNLPKIEVDPAQIQQILFNLIENAVEALPEGGKIFIRTRNQPSDMITIEIEDTGVGIPADKLSLLFKPFYTTKPLGKGTGLGLAIVYGIIKLHRGQITVSSEVSKGTTFTIQLPIKHISIDNASQIPGFWEQYNP
ncbi:MAG: cache domain-containing protein [Anaerolineales bacterium]|nr:cache domain-containing protein [Anaerolineales bacterium]